MQRSWTNLFTPEAVLTVARFSVFRTRSGFPLLRTKPHTHFRLGHVLGIFRLSFQNPKKSLSEVTNLRGEFWSGRPGSNRRRPAWEAGILPLNYARSGQGSVASKMYGFGRRLSTRVDLCGLGMARLIAHQSEEIRRGHFRYHDTEDVSFPMHHSVHVVFGK